MIKLQYHRVFYRCCCWQCFRLQYFDVDFFRTVEVFVVALPSLIQFSMYRVFGQVILYENAALAESLCHLNKWDHCTIPIHALEVALQLRQLDTVAFFLRNQQNGKLAVLCHVLC